MKIENTDTKKILNAITGLGTRIDGLESGFGTRMGGLESGLSTRIDDLESGIGTRMNGLESGLGTRMNGLESRQNEMIEMMQTYSEDVEHRFLGIEGRFGAINQHLEKIETEQIRMRSVMIDKDYFDRKLGDFKGDVIAALKKGDQRVNALVSTLKQKRTITTKEADTILARPAFVPGRA